MMKPLLRDLKMMELRNQLMELEAEENYEKFTADFNSTKSDHVQVIIHYDIIKHSCGVSSSTRQYMVPKKWLKLQELS